MIDHTIKDRAAMFASAFSAATSPAAPPPPAEQASGEHVAAAEAMGARGGPASEPERLAFEAWMRGHCWALCATWNGTEYRSDAEQGGWYCGDAARTRMLWAAWRDRAALSQRPVESCAWTLESTPHMEAWSSACGELWSFVDGGPEDNNVKFCHGCGKPVAPQQPEGEEA